MTTSKVPQIRFKSFNEDWEEKTLESISEEISYGLTIRPQFITDGIPLISARELKNGYIDYKIAPRISKADYDKLSEKAKGKKGDIFLTKTGTIGLSAYVSEDIPIAITQNISFIRITNEIFNHQFILQTFKTKNFYNSAISKVNQSTIMDLQLQDIRKLSIYFPDKLEQINVSNYFQKLDKLIEQKEKKYQKLKQFKKAMLDKMFPKKEADTPEIRFKGFSVKWEEKKLGQLAKITTGSSNRQDSGLDGQYTFFDRSDDIRTSNIYLFDGEAVIVAGEGSDFVPKYFKGKFDLHQRTYAIMNFENGDSKFLFYYIHLFRKWFLNQAVGSTVKSLRLPMFQEMVINYPRKEEQEKIGNYFQKLDNQIDLLQKELEKLKNIKKASLAKMFV